jgi:hypothetical protein
MEKNSSYKAIVVIPDNSEEGGRRGLRYNTPDLLDFQRFLDKQYPEWLWFNVFDKEGNQIANYTKNKRALTRRVP